ncbi:hypothetical protein BURMUCF2_A1862 [Burkholderia multivorans CF2]|nr:hypothetical protein BURMUCF2_A1862 [Burkholderia multivorans CF2]
MLSLAPKWLSVLSQRCWIVKEKESRSSDEKPALFPNNRNARPHSATDPDAHYRGLLNIRTIFDNAAQHRLFLCCRKFW